jgi:hypothetical protein
MPADTSLAERFARHAACLDRAASDPEATPDVADLLRVGAAAARVASVLSVPIEEANR